MKNIYDQLAERKRQKRKSFAVLIDPDKMRHDDMEKIIRLSTDAKVDYFFVGVSRFVSKTG